MLSFIILGASFVLVGRNYTLHERQETLESNALELSRLASAYASEGALDGWSFRIVLSSIAQSTGNHCFLANTGGVIVTCSAGTMNSASAVYCSPEEKGEAADRKFCRFLRGLGLTDVMVMPHYQDNKDSTVDGLRLYEDITAPDSMGRKITVLCDGSYILKEKGVQTLYGEAYLMKDGVMTPLCRDGESIVL